MGRRSTEEWNLIDRGAVPDDDEHARPADEPGADGEPPALEKTDRTRSAPDSGAGSEPPD